MNSSLVTVVLLLFLVLTLIAPFSALAGLMVLLLVSAVLLAFWNLVGAALRGNVRN